MENLLKELTSDLAEGDAVGTERRIGLATILAKRAGWDVEPFVFAQRIVGITAHKKGESLVFVGRVFGDNEGACTASRPTKLTKWANLL